MNNFKPQLCCWCQQNNKSAVSLFHSSTAFRRRNLFSFQICLECLEYIFSTKTKKWFEKLLTDRFYNVWTSTRLINIFKVDQLSSIKDLSFVVWLDQINLCFSLYPNNFCSWMLWWIMWAMGLVWSWCRSFQSLKVVKIFFCVYWLCYSLKHSPESTFSPWVELDKWQVILNFQAAWKLCRFWRKTVNEQFNGRLVVINRIKTACNAPGYIINIKRSNWYCFSYVLKCTVNLCDCL